MWFRNLQIFRLRASMSFETLENVLAQHALQPCASNASMSIGWVPPRPDGGHAYTFDLQWLIALGVEQKLLPAAVVRQHALARAQIIEGNEGRRVGRREFRDLQEQALQELLPRAFVRRRTTRAWIDPLNDWLVVDAASPGRADELLAHLQRSVEGLEISHVRLARSPGAAMTGWLADGQAPSGFSIDQDAELQSAENALVRYAKHTLDVEDIPVHIAGGKVVTRLGMTWGDKISFVLNDKLQLKRLAFLDILKESTHGQAENEAERFDLDFALMTGELALLLGHLVLALGGEVVGEV